MYKENEQFAGVSEEISGRLAVIRVLGVGVRIQSDVTLIFHNASLAG